LDLVWISFLLFEILNGVDRVVSEKVHCFGVDILHGDGLDPLKHELDSRDWKPLGQMGDELKGGSDDVLMLFWQAALPDHIQNFLWESIFMLYHEVKDVLAPLYQLLMGVFFENELQYLVVQDPLREDLQGEEHGVF
jgi:hypothetical protein